MGYRVAVVAAMNKQVNPMLVQKGFLDQPWRGDDLVDEPDRFENFAPGSYTVTGSPAGPQPFQVQEGRTTVVTLP